MRDASEEYKQRHPASAVGVPAEKDYQGSEEHFLPEITEIFNGFKDFELQHHGKTFQELAKEVGQEYMHADSKSGALGGEYQENYMARVVLPLMAAAEEAEEGEPPADS